jgi:tetratricopeptide (TPR) repeat protein
MSATSMDTSVQCQGFWVGASRLAKPFSGDDLRDIANLGHTIIMRKLIAAAVICICMISSACLAADKSEVPPESQAKLEDIFTGVNDQLWKLNDRYWHTGQFERSIAALRLIAEIAPDDTQAYSNGAFMMQNQERDDEAEVFLLEGLRKNPGSSEMLYELGYFCYMHQRFEEAVAYFKQVVLLAPDWQNWHLLAHSYEHAGNVQEALNIWYRMLLEEPNSPVPQMQIDRILSGKPPPRAPEMERHSS